MGSKSSHSTANALRRTFLCVAAGAAMAMSAVAGAWVQAQFSGERSTHATGQLLAQTDAPRVDAGYIRENIGVLASKMGDMQARVIALEGLARRVAEAAGVSYTDPEVQLSIEQLLSHAETTSSAAVGQAWTAESLGRELDGIERQLTMGGEQLTLLDAVLTQRVGVRESLPTLSPVDYPQTSSSYGWRRHPITGRHTLHEGLDFAAPKGTPILAASGGIVTEARYVPGYGKMVEISHGNGLVTRYAHASSISVKPGELVTRGQQIARVGSTGRSTGAHLHFEVRVAGHPLDPTLFIEPWSGTPEDGQDAVAVLLKEEQVNDATKMLANADSELAASGVQLR